MILKHINWLSLSFMAVALSSSALGAGVNTHIGSVSPEPTMGRATIDVINDSIFAVRCDVRATGQVASQSGSGPIHASIAAPIQTVVIRADSSQTLLFNFMDRLTALRQSWSDPTALLVAVNNSDISLTCVEDQSGGQSGNRPVPTVVPNGLEPGTCLRANNITRESNGAILPSSDGQGNVRCSNGTWVRVASTASCVLSNGQYVSNGYESSNGLICQNGQWMPANGQNSHETCNGRYMPNDGEPYMCTTNGWVKLNDTQVDNPTGGPMCNGVPMSATYGDGCELQCLNGHWVCSAVHNDNNDNDNEIDLEDIIGGIIGH